MMPAASKCFISISGFIYTKFLIEYLNGVTYTHLGLLINGDFGMRNVKAGE
jgi:hypothetical protein